MYDSRFTTLPGGDAFSHLREMFPECTWAISGDCVDVRSLWWSVCHPDGTRCDWIPNPLDLMSWTPGETFQKCCHGQDCIFQRVAIGQPRIVISAA